MKINVKEYRYSLDYDIDGFFSGIKKEIEFDNNLPLIVTGTYHNLDKDYDLKVKQEFLSGHKRSKPSECLLANHDTLEKRIAKILKMTGPVFSMSSTCTSSAYAFYNAHALSKTYNSPVIVATADSMNEYTKYWFNSLGAIGKGISFDVNSKGFKPGQALSFFIVDHKSKPIFTIENLNFWSTGEETGVANLDNIIDKLKFYNFEDISFWNAHAPGTIIGDKAELKIFQSLIKKDIPISSLKSQIGHTIRSCFAVEICIGIDNLKKGIISGNKGISSPIDLDHRIITEDISSTSDYFFKFCLGFGGKAAAALVRIHDT